MNKKLREKKKKIIIAIVVVAIVVVAIIGIRMLNPGPNNINQSDPNMPPTGQELPLPTGENKTLPSNGSGEEAPIIPVAPEGRVQPEDINIPIIPVNK